MRKALWLILLVPLLCFGQKIAEIEEEAYGQGYAPGASIIGHCHKDITGAAEDSTAIWYFYVGHWTGNGLGIVIKMDSTASSTWIDSLKVELAPMIGVQGTYTGGIQYTPIWTDAVTLQTKEDDTSCNYWSPTAEKYYSLYHDTWFRGVAYRAYACRLTNQSIETDSCDVNYLALQCLRY